MQKRVQGNAPARITKRKLRQFLFLLVGVTAAGGALLYYVPLYQEQRDQQRRFQARQQLLEYLKSPPTNHTPGLDVLHPHLGQTDRGQYVEGTIKNQTPERFAYVEAKITVLDKKKNEIEGQLVAVRNLDPGKEYPFRFNLKYPGAVEVKVGEINGFR